MPDQPLLTECPTEQLNWYVNGTLSPDERREIEVHLAHCQYCQAELASLQALRSAFRAMLVPVPGDDLFQRVEQRVAAAQSIRLLTPLPQGIHVGGGQFLWQLLATQTRLIRRQIWLASAMTLLLGWIVVWVINTTFHTPDGTSLALVAPLIAALGLSVIYGPDNDVSLELTLTMPTSPRQVLLARFVLVFGYDAGITLLLFLLSKVLLSAVSLTALFQLWIGPMFFLSGLALLLSMTINPNMAVLVSLILWVLRIEAVAPLTSMDAQWPWYGVLQAFWSSPLFLVGLSGICFLLCLWVVRREDFFV